MARTIYASFSNTTQCEQAVGALLDYGVSEKDVSFVANESYQPTIRDTRSASDGAGMVPDTGYRGGSMRGGAVLDRPIDSYGVVESGKSEVDRDMNDDHADATTTIGVMQGSTVFGGQPVPITGTANVYDVSPDDSVEDPTHSAKTGISVTMAADAASGAATGAGWGLGAGVIAGLACLAIPGVGWVIGGGALATAIGAAAGTTVAGAIAGGVLGYLKDQGVPDHVAADHQSNLLAGGAVIAVTTPSGQVDTAMAESILHKYGATSVDTY
jgi:hypothetical protein